MFIFRHRFDTCTICMMPKKLGLEQIKHHQCTCTCSQTYDECKTRIHNHFILHAYVQTDVYNCIHDYMHEYMQSGNRYVTRMITTCYVYKGKRIIRFVYETRIRHHWLHLSHIIAGSSPGSQWWDLRQCVTGCICICGHPKPCEIHAQQRESWGWHLICWPSNLQLCKATARYAERLLPDAELRRITKRATIENLFVLDRGPLRGLRSNRHCPVVQKNIERRTAIIRSSHNVSLGGK